MSTDMTGPALIDSATLAGPDWLNLPSARTLDQWAYQGLGPRFVKVGRHRRYRPADVLAWLEAQTVSSGAA
ncbi:MAG: helix-turn-helix transcriptional regulator [Ilumatobacteraceae bacterium]